MKCQRFLVVSFTLRDIILMSVTTQQIEPRGLIGFKLATYAEPHGKLLQN